MKVFLYFYIYVVAQVLLAAINSAVPTFEFTSTSEPTDWQYLAPSSPAIWFEARDAVQTDLLTPTISSYVTSSGGAILEVISTGTNNTYIVRGYVPAADAYQSNYTTVQLSDGTCNLDPSCSAVTTVHNAPVCNMYAVDMAYCGAEGLVTDRETALLVAVCSEPMVGLCAPSVQDCVTINGPTGGNVSYINLVDSTTSYYQMLISWDASYNGPAVVSVDCALTGATSGLPLAEPITPLAFKVVPIVAVRASAYKIGSTTISVPAPALAPGASDKPAR